MNISNFTRIIDGDGKVLAIADVGSHPLTGHEAVIVPIPNGEIRVYPDDGTVLLFAEQGNGKVYISRLKAAP